MDLSNKALGLFSSFVESFSIMLGSGATSSVPFWMTSAGVLVPLWILYSVVYELYWSPLRRYPGPKLWAISRIPLQLSVLRGHNHLDITALHERYGPVLRISPNELAFNTPQAFRDIYGFRPGGCFPKDRSHYIPPANGVDHLVCAVDNAVHARQRRLLAPAFSERALRDQEGLIKGYVDTMIGKLRSEIAKHGLPRVDIKIWMNYTTFDITGDLMFGESFDCLKDNQLHPWIQLIFNSIKALALAGTAKQFPILDKVLNALLPMETKRKAEQHFQLAAQKVDRRLEASIARPDFMSAILQNGLSEKKGQYLDSERIMSRAEIHSNAFILIVAGSETSATLISGCVFYLCTHSHVMAGLVKEIRSAFAKDEDITFRSTASLKYLNAVIEESLRLYPPFVTSLARIVPPGGSEIDGRFVSEGTVVACHHYASYHSSSNFSFPNDFMPERWLGNDARFEKDKKDVLQPFSLGPRNCLGKNLAYCEIRLILCKLLYNFDLVLCRESAKWTDQKVYFLWDKPALMVTLKDRFPEAKKANAE
ncbi:uncharacterized protein N7459_002196 [Penicillium hispanicum]|uniref:uncharacterized protein n=1 Tax=Penicillium hispanicum TaxID=1080232 RepID=UPI002541B3EA|nr:uncharacterized protein N7459_002196 [Penicillium hispanicum]KAJ5591827.1 hypothetical protein N7459_002196 [Penicillium hispanicum]